MGEGRSRGGMVCSHAAHPEVIWVLWCTGASSAVWDSPAHTSLPRCVFMDHTGGLRSAVVEYFYHEQSKHYKSGFSTPGPARELVDQHTTALGASGIPHNHTLRCKYHLLTKAAAPSTIPSTKQAQFRPTHLPKNCNVAQPNLLSENRRALTVMAGRGLCFDFASASIFTISACPILI